LSEAVRRTGEIFAIGEAGRAATELGPGRPSRFPDSADHELTECRVPGATVRAASVRGLMHRYQDQPRQDRFSVVFDDPTRTLVVTVCDGVGQFKLSQEAAGFVAADAPRAYLEHRDWQVAVADVNKRLRDFVAATAARPHLDEASSEGNMATTLVAAAICLDPEDRHASVAWTDDSAVWLLAEGSWSNLTPHPEIDDDELYAGRVKALPHADPTVNTARYAVGGDPIFLMTDGVGVPLESSEQVRDTLAGWWTSPPDIFTFAQQVGFARKGHMDDRTVVGVWFEAVPT
jgi:hypothetical protein